jgi:hypothetical protein
MRVLDRDSEGLWLIAGDEGRFPLYQVGIYSGEFTVYRKDGPSSRDPWRALEHAPLFLLPFILEAAAKAPWDPLSSVFQVQGCPPTPDRFAQVHELFPTLDNLVYRNMPLRQRIFNNTRNSQLGAYQDCAGEVRITDSLWSEALYRGAVARSNPQYVLTGLETNLRRAWATEFVPHPLSEEDLSQMITDEVVRVVVEYREEILR